MNKARFAVAVGLLTVGTALSQASGWYYTEASFLSAINDSAVADFDDLDGAYNALPSYNWSSNGFSWSASTDPGFSSLFALGVLPSGNGALSVNDNRDNLKFTFGGPKTVTAFGGYFFNTDTQGLNLGGNVTLNLAGGPVSAALTTPFLGYVGTSAITSATVSGDGAGGYITADHVVSANATPEPFTMGLGLASAAVFVRRRLKATKS